MKRTILLIATLVASFITSAPAFAKKNVAPQPVQAEIEEASGFATLRISDSKILLDYDTDFLNRPIVISSTVSKTSNYKVAGVGFRTDALYSCFERVGNQLYLRKLNADTSVNPNDPSMAQRISESHGDILIASFPIIAEKGKRLTIDITDFFLYSKECSALGMRFARAKGRVNKALTYTKEVKSFEKNVFARTVSTYDYTDRDGREGQVTTELGHTILLLPESKMPVRLADSRAGFFTQTKTRLDFAESDRYQYECEILERYRVEPSDWEAWKRGEKVAPVQKIVWYIDNEFPAEWSKPLKEGIEMWNEVFEEIGLKDVVEARVFPTKDEDPDFDVDNLAYSCVRWIPTDRGGAMGPSWYDPTTGEVISSSVYVWGSLLENQNRRAFVQTAQANPDIRSGRLQGETLNEMLRGIICHEVGHTLGLAHNMAGSSTFTIEQLQDKDFVKKNGLTTSLMDYIYFNYIITPEQEGNATFLAAPIGVYDKMVLHYIYTPQDTTLTLREDAALVAKIIDQHAGDPAYRYVRQQWGNPDDPTAVIDDISNDAVEASRLAFGNLQYVLEHMNGWLEGSGEHQRQYRAFIYEGIYEHYALMLQHAAQTLGGIRKAETILGSEGKNYEPIESDYQLKALELTAKELRRSSWIDYAPVRSQFQLKEAYSDAVISKTVGVLLARLENVDKASRLPQDKAYTLGQYTDDLFRLFFQQVSKPTATDKAIQRQFVKNLKELKSNDKKSAIIQASASILLDKIKLWSETRAKSANSDDAIHYKTLNI